MKKKTILVGAGGSGKDYLRQKFQKRGHRFAVTHVTRPPREGEQSGVDAQFITTYDFLEMKKRGEFIETAEFNGWRYGTSKKTFEEYDVFIMNPAGISQIPKELREACLVIYIDITEAIRRERLTSRRDSNDSIERRLSTDREDFKNFTDFDVRITNPEF